MKFSWRSPLGASVALFLGWGLMWAAGLVGIFVLFAGGFPPWLLFSAQADRALLGSDPGALRAAQPAAAEAQWLLSHLLGMVIACAGIAISSLAWFGLRRASRWAFWTLVACALPLALVFPYAVLRYLRLGVPLGWWDLQPFVTIPALLVPPAILLGWIGLRAAVADDGGRP